MKQEKLNQLLSQEEPREIRDKKTEKKFQPKFNVREEFPLWIRDQFPKLKEHAKTKRVYEALEQRKSEVYEAALGALTQGVNSTDACARGRLYGGWTALKKGFDEQAKPKIRAKSLEKFVEALEDLSISLGGDKHFTQAGKSLGGASYSSWKDKKAFVYRVGGENSKDATYLVYEEAQQFNGNPQGSVLIGELDDLSEWQLRRIKEESEKFRGDEESFVNRIDNVAPEGGYYSSTSSYSSGSYRGSSGKHSSYSRYGGS